jgi:hypothetical protein
MLSCSNIDGSETGLIPTNQAYRFGGNALIHKERDRRVRATDFVVKSYLL